MAVIEDSNLKVGTQDVLATFCGTEQQFLNGPALFRAQAGRSGAFYGWSWDEILAANERALGPELVSDAWTTYASGEVTYTSENRLVSLVRTGPGTNGFPVLLLSGLSPEKTYVLAFSVAGAITTVRAGTSAGGGQLASVNASAGAQTMVIRGAVTTYLALWPTSVGSSQVKVSFREVDMAKIVAFEDANGMVPLLSPLNPGKGCGLLLDQEHNLARGPELLLDPGFDTGAGWSSASTAPATASIAGGVLTIASDGVARGRMRSVITTVSERWYEAICEGFDGVELWVGSSEGGAERLSSGVTGVPGVYKFKAVGTTTYVQLSRASPGTFTAAGLSIREVLGNHLSQPTAAARGELSRRVNALGRTTGNLFASPEWGGTGLSGTVQADGSTLLKRTTTDSSGYTSSTGFYPVGSLLKASVKAKKAADGNLVGLRIQGTYPDRVDVLLNLDTGVLLTSAGTNFTDISSAVTPLADGWFLIELIGRATANTGTAASLITGPGKFSTAGWEGFTTTLAEVLVKDPDLRLAADAGLPYQWVKSAAEYDEVGFPAFMRRQVDDWMRSRINPNGATKALMLTAVQKMSDATAGCIFEASESNATSLGSVAMFAPNVAASNYMVRSRATGQADLVVSGYSAPARHIVRGYSQNNPGTVDELTLHINGMLAGSSPTNQGDGPYLEREYFIGARAGTSFFVNYREYTPPILLFMQAEDPGLSAWEIQQVENRINRYIKAY